MDVPAPQAVIFDCDGVLVDSEIIAIEVELAALSAVGVPLTAAELATRYVGMAAAEQAVAVREEFGVALDDAWWATLEARSHEALTERSAPVAGMRAVVAGLTRPYCLASSSSHPRIELTLRAAGLLDLFDAGRRFSADDVTHGKPAPDLFLHATAAHGWDPSTCVVVEDSPHGVRAAIAAGMTVIGFTAGGHAGPAWADRLHEAGARTVVGAAADLADLLA